MNQCTTTGETTVCPESLEKLFKYRSNPAYVLQWDHVFSLPVWMQEWRRAFWETKRIEILSLWRQQELIGIAPLRRDGHKALFIGDADVCDYLDFIVVPDEGAYFFNALLDHLASHDIDELELRCLRPESHAICELVPVLEARSIAFDCEPDGISLETRLPGTWEAYLERLNSKQRHEVRRKLRRLNESGDIRFAVYDAPNDILGNRDVFFKLFRDSRTDKTEFMTPKMVSFFSAMMSSMAGAGILKMGMMYMDEAPVAAVLYFDYQGRIYLYNNGYDPRLRDLSVGVLSKILLIQHAIAGEMQIFDFLKGSETYKYRLGGNEIQLSRLNIRLK